MALQQAVQAQLQVLRSQLGAIVSRFAAIDDPRRANSVQDPLPTVLLHGMLLFVFQFASRRKGNEGLSCPAMRAALAAVLPACESTPIRWIACCSAFRRTRSSLCHAAMCRV